MKKETLLTVVVIALLLLNFGTLFFLLSRRPHGGPEGPKMLDRAIAEKLHFDDKQKEQFDAMKRAHHEQILARDREYRELLHQYFALLQQDSVSAANQDSMLNRLAGIQADKARLTFRHFQDLKAMSAPEYRKNFADLLPELMQVMLPQPKRKGPEND